MRHWSPFFYCLITPFFFAINTRAQTYRHTAVWTRIAPSYSLSKNWTLLSDLYFRRQSNPNQGPAHLLDSPLVWAGRVGASYRTKHWQYSLFPAVYFYTYPALGTAADLKRTPVPEWRPTAMAEWTLDVPHKSIIRLRVGYEYRLYTPSEPADVGRLRFRALWRRTIGNRAYGQVWNESLVAAPPNFEANGNRFEINRTNLSAGYALSNISTVEVGYQFTHRQRRSLVEFDDEHALTLTLYLKLNQ
ncbi:DUF2490 domain-containing protein [Fibrella forsythiae]|uniref:DUF2490 domain-containing protein n=1 Tax=Fibrella forsythiae TaxID=2817061 RepID=A0ABS3JHG0_9BACT|nr:DUF2490 domain-containing protein [Fibrella forsythiae]MBO0949449.1 DUF2490 domain-containing protein [Fibrella forsythiae]